MRGVSLIDLLVAIAMAGLVVVAGGPALVQMQTQARAQAGARYLATCIQRARLEAARRGVHVALRFEETARGWQFTTYVDGNGNGVRTADIARGIDGPAGPPDALTHHFGDVDARVVWMVPGIDGSPALAAGSTPVRLGSGSMLSWSPLGTASSGTIYVGPPRGPQLAVRVFGATGRVRVFRFAPGAGQWQGL